MFQTTSMSNFLMFIWHWWQTTQKTIFVFHFNYNVFPKKNMTWMSKFWHGCNFNVVKTLCRKHGEKSIPKNTVGMDFDHSKSTTIKKVLMLIKKYLANIKVFQNDIVWIPILRCQNDNVVSIFLESVPNFLRLKTSL